MARLTNAELAERENRIARLQLIQTRLEQLEEIAHHFPDTALDELILEAYELLLRAKKDEIARLHHRKLHPEVTDINQLFRTQPKEQ
jgi:biotin-(acetyl-CoA carboxylase) ligase